MTDEEYLVAAHHEAAHVVAALYFGHHVPYVIVNDDTTGLTAGSGEIIRRDDAAVKGIIGPVFEATHKVRLNGGDLTDLLEELEDEWAVERSAHESWHLGDEDCGDLCYPFSSKAIRHALDIIEDHGALVRRIGDALVERGRLEWSDIESLARGWEF